MKSALYSILFILTLVLEVGEKMKSFLGLVLIGAMACHLIGTVSAGPGAGEALTNVEAVRARVAKVVDFEINTLNSEKLDRLRIKLEEIESILWPKVNERISQDFQVSRISMCNQLNLRTVPEGTSCKTSTYRKYQLVDRSTDGREVWKDRRSGALWSDVIGVFTYNEARTACRQLSLKLNGVQKNGWKLPSRDEFDVAVQNGFHEVLPRIKDHWSETKASRYRPGMFYKYSPSPVWRRNNTNSMTSANVTYHVRCLSLP